MRVLDLFSGIGGFSLGLERTGGFKTKAFCEIDPFCWKVLDKHWPKVPIHEDVEDLRGAAVGAVDVVAGGFPCQDISFASSGLISGLDGARSGLWKEVVRLVGELGPKFVIVENVPALRSRGLVEVLQDFRSLGYDAEWHCIPACAVGAPHERDRIWILAHPAGMFREAIIRREPNRNLQQDEYRSVADPDGEPLVRAAIARGESHPWAVEPGVGRLVHGVSDRVAKLRVLGNTVVPQVVEFIGNSILEAMEKEKGPVARCVPALD